MKLTTSWLKPPYASSGIDHLGTQAPCVMIYGQLLPGITNVTDRARYYSFYPWLVWSYDQRYAKDDYNHFVERFRRADCLFTLIAERHAQATDHKNERHGVAMVGRTKLVPSLTSLKAGEPLRLSLYATTRETPQRYFMNRLGGLSQYYAGTLADLQLMESSGRSWSSYSSQYGAPLAQSVELSVPGDRFWEVVENDSVTLDELDEMSSFCACNIPGSQGELQQLADIFFDADNRYSEEGAQRRRSLGLIQQLADTLANGWDLTEEVFRGCVYSAALPNGEAWEIPDALQATRAHWAVYVRNDLMSVAFQTILAICLQELQPQSAAQRRVFHSVEAFADWFSGSETVARVVSDLGAASFDDLVTSSRANAPELTDWTNEAHEIQLSWQLIGGWAPGVNIAPLLSQSLSLLAMLAARDDLEQQPYSGLAITSEALRDYPINLISFRSRNADWKTMPLEHVVADLVIWCLDTHLRVALRKLRQSNRSTFHLRPSERGLEVVGDQIPPPSSTTPRFRQAVQILRDLGMLERDESHMIRLTASGRKRMEVASV
ncbi:hypothetical protein IPC426_19075 [Pseudomonas aeruginosa]|uniref:hypothetical protein n=1 Tax=Pseudomonas aeruginosa TaxID=287 RepID=UPI00053D7C60|nr:hypothetical protein [Pseudomonas aeruginosa]ELH0224887.1 hypothetical protein [Pseudomonas aeruginosa]ELK4793144.1 hypothetical protein [Pseudomonas aeruginosa]MBG5240199.1 hypothetical protein [Pseudomonas aeruginosa]MBH3762804.1 hypothetical protein [Pseudomonas aeruginosa]MBH9154045.1 hypothetical protein [Pseudomonas aeruginosa]